MMEAEVGAIIGGCIAGAVVFIIFIAIIIYLICGKRRRRKEREDQKFRVLTPHTSPAHSQPSTISQGIHPTESARLPKVSSNGLWVGAPGIYASTPSPAYAIGRPQKSHYLMQPAVLQRASSDPRLIQTRGQATGGPSVFPTGGSQQRIYHSQGLPSPLSPVYELRDPNNGSVYDVYQIGGGSTTRLLQDSDRGNKRVQRSQSDVVPDPIRRAYRTSAELRASRASSNRSTTGSAKRQNTDSGNNQNAGISNRQNTGSFSTQNTDDLNKDDAQIHQPGGLDNPMFIESVAEKISQEEKVAVVASATDSMKLLAKNKTDDQKTVSNSSASENQSSASENIPSQSRAPNQAPGSPSLHYNYQGDIYAIPDKEVARHRSTSNDPSPAQNVLADDTTHNNAAVGSVHIADHLGYGSSVTANPIYQEVGDHQSYEPALTQTSIYEEVGEVLRQRREETTAQGTDKTRAGASLVARAGNGHDAASGSNDVAVSDVAAASAGTSKGEVGASGSDSQAEARALRRLEQQLSSDTEGTADELSRAGKNISVTAEAFGFLDTYLSDEEGTDILSPPQSPIMTDRSEM